MVHARVVLCRAIRSDRPAVIEWVAAGVAKVTKGIKGSGEMSKQLDIRGGILVLLAYRIAPFTIGMTLGYVEFQWVNSLGPTGSREWMIILATTAFMVWAAVHYPKDRPRASAIAVTVVLAWQILFVAWSISRNGFETPNGETLAAYIAAGAAILVGNYMVYFTSWGKANFNNWRRVPGFRRTKKP